MTGTSPSQPDFSRQLQNPMLLQAAMAMNENRLHDAEPLLRQHLKADPFDVAAIRMLAELAGRIGRMKDAEALLRRAIELAPNFVPARSNLAIVLYRQNRAAEAITELETLAKISPNDVAHDSLKAAAKGRLGDYEEAIELYGSVLERFPGQPKIWMSYGHLLKTVGQQAQSVLAYRRALEIAPALGEVWWSLANLKTVSFDDADLDVMHVGLARDDISSEDRFHLHFALGKAFEDRKQAEPAFHHYAQGNRLRAAELETHERNVSQHVAAAKALFTPEFFARRAGQGCLAEDPVFILGLPRAGSTLLEQILSTHSQVEGTMELPDIPHIAAQLGTIDQWPERLAAASPDDLRRMGETFLERTTIQRKTGKPFFIDKLPNNWIHVGLIHLILPNALIIDARRHPMACCFSNFKQHFARGQGFTYDLTDIGRYYADYVDLMAHFDRVLPGRVVRVFHENMVEDSAAEIRHLLDALGLPFEEACLRFWENDRAVRTASSEQVRRPIFRDGTDQWRIFDPWLGELKTALGPVLTAYPAIPAI
ncbi:MAG: sulfotransferase family protein [Sphingomonadaceae bacterium]|nr:sulfotransferase family protein [Sphingomonadaceae bacterium]